jgi:hypothetical protein
MLSLATDYSIPTCFAQGAANLIAGGLNMVTEDSNVPISLKVKVWNPAVFERKYKTVKRSLKSKKVTKSWQMLSKPFCFTAGRRLPDSLKSATVTPTTVHLTKPPRDFADCVSTPVQ